MIRSLTALFYLLIVITAANAQWQTMNLDSSVYYNSVCFINENTGWISVGGDYILKTTNSGVNWQHQVSNSPEGVNNLIFTSPTTGYGLNALYNLIVKTTNAGTNWGTIPVPELGTTWAEMFFINNTGYIYGGSFNGDRIIRTTNGGTLWQTIPLPTYFETLHAFNSTTAVAGGFDMKLYKTTNSGSNWFVYSNLPFFFTQMVFYGDVGYGTGSSHSVVAKTTNGGLNWDLPSFVPLQKNIYDIYAVNENIVYAVGDDGYIVRTTNGGINWESESILSEERFLSISMANENVGFIAGGWNTALKRTDGIGIQQISSNIPNGYILGQNYPNPFNPVTNIEFSIPKSSFVRLTVFDLTGREIAVPVNKELKAGTYRVDFNSEMLSSGTYFYRINAGDFVETKKMILIK